MSDELIEQCLELADLPEGTSLAHVVEALVALQVASHPDRFLDPATKAQATERFKRVTELLGKVRTQVERAQLDGAASKAIQLRQHDAPGLRKDLEISRLVTELAEREQSLQYAAFVREKAEQEAARLKKQLEAKRSENVRLSRDDIGKRYKPKPGTLAGVGITGLLATLYAIFGQLETIAGKFLAPLGLPPRAFGFCLFGMFAAATSVTIYGYLRANFLKKAAGSICTTAALQRLMSKLSSTGAKSGRIEFAEHDVVNFINVELRVQATRNRILGWLGLGRAPEEALEQLKEILLGHMLARGLIEVGPIESLQRIFRTKERATVRWSDGDDLFNSEIPF